MNYTLLIIVAAVAIFVAYSYFKIQRLKRMPLVADSDKLHVLTDKSFAHQIKSGVTLVDFWAPWCMPCKMMAPTLNELAVLVNGKHKVGKLNVDEYQSVAVQYNVRNIPTLLLFKDGKEIDRFVGVKSKDFLLKQMSKY